jgi:hypothetical protein
MLVHGTVAPPALEVSWVHGTIAFPVGLTSRHTKKNAEESCSSALHRRIRWTEGNQPA